MAVPKNRLSKTRQKMRRANWKLTTQLLNKSKHKKRPLKGTLFYVLAGSKCSVAGHPARGCRLFPADIKLQTIPSLPLHLLCSGFFYNSVLWEK